MSKPAILIMTGNGYQRPTKAGTTYGYSPSCNRGKERRVATRRADVKSAAFCEVTCLGDVCVPSNAGIPKAFFDGICGGEQAASNILVANIESAISGRGEPVAPKYACLRRSAEGIEGLAALDVGVLGNNHITDYGHDAATDTIRHLKNMGVRPQGYGNNLRDALAPAIIEKNGIKIGILSFVCPTTNGWNAATPVTPGVAPMSPSLMRDQLWAVKPIVDALFVYLHWGLEQDHYVVPGQIRTARQLVEWGANAVIGVHGHVIQPYEQYKQGHIFYGLGNAAFGDVEYRQWDMNGNVSTGIHKQRRRNLESLAPVFEIHAGESPKVLLKQVRTLRYANERIHLVSRNQLAIDVDNINWCLRLYSWWRKRILKPDANIEIRLLHNGGYHYCAYAEASIANDPLWRYYDRVNRFTGGYLERGLKRLLNRAGYEC